MVTNFRRQIGEISELAFILGTRIPQRMEDGKENGRVDTPDVLCTSRKNLVNFGPLTPEFTTLIWQPF